MVKVLTPPPASDSVCPLRLALIVPWLISDPAPPTKRCEPMVPLPCTVTPEPSVRIVPVASMPRLPVVLALPRLMVALLKLCVPSKNSPAFEPVTFATPDATPASVNSVSPLKIRALLEAPDKSSVPRKVTPSSVFDELVKISRLVPLC